MVGSLKGVVSQLSVVQGQHRQRADSILIIDSEDGLAPGRSRGRLYALIELSGLVAPPPELRRNLQEIVKREFYGSTGSIASSLEQAIVQINGHLYAFNRDSMREHRQGGGVTLAVLRGSDLYIAQGGPAAAYLSQDNRVLRYPQYSPWLDESVDAKPADESPRFLGASRQVKVELFHGQVQAGDCLVLAELLLGQIASPDQVQGALSCGDATTSAESLANLVGTGEDIAMAVVQFEPDTPGFGAPARDESAPEPRPLVRRPVGRKVGAGVRRASPTRSGGIHLPPIPRPEIDWQKLGDRVRATLAVLLALAVRLLKQFGHTAKVLFIRTLPSSADGAETPDARKPKGKAAKGKSKESKEPKAPPRPAPPEEQPLLPAEAGPTAAAKPGRRLAILDTARQSKALKAAALVIPILVIAIVGLVYFEKNQETRGRFTELVQSAQANQEKALAEMADVNQARALLTAALKSLDEAAVISPQATEVTQLRKDILNKIDQVNQVKRMYWSPELHRYGAPGTDLRRIIVDGINIYVLDRGKNQVFKHTLNETNDGFTDSKDNPVIVKQGDQVGDVVVAELLDMTWVPAGGGRQTSNLVILDKKGALFDYSPTFGVKHRPLADTSKWLSPQTVHGFYGNLYVMDTHLNQVMKYLPTAGDNGYSSAPLNYLSDKLKADLTGAIDMAIDGSIYIMYANGTIAKFLNGEPKAFQITGLEQPLNNPSALFVSTDEGTQYVYIADRGNRRMVQLTKEGRFQRQFKVSTNAFDDLRSLWVDELDQKMYALSGISVFAANLVSE